MNAKQSSLTALPKLFKTPTSEFRGAPFWAWNGELTPEACRQQIRLFHDGGIGGFFMHSRTGLKTPYLSDRWFECVDACIDEAKRLGMKPWLYDEDRWPSGAAGGLVTKDPQFRSRALVVHLCPAGVLPSELVSDSEKSVTPTFLNKFCPVAVFVAKLCGEKASCVRYVPSGSDIAPAADETVLLFTERLESPSPWYNGQTYLDTMNPAAVRRFIEVTHETYAARLGAELGSSVPGIFTDEPNIHHRIKADLDKDGNLTALSCPWTPSLPDVFRALAGYDVLPRLIELFYELENTDSSRFLFDFQNCLTELFTKSFMKQIGDWCEEHKISFTGHVLAEDSLHAQTCSGSCMRCYEYMQVPGMDMLTEKWRPFTTAKQLSSVAHQFDRKWRITETYGTTGWDFSFAGHKALGDWQAALGVNFFCQHLAWYTMKGQAKRDYPASIFFQSPWWEHYNKVQDYFGRIFSVMTRGEEQRDILFLHPNESSWTLRQGLWGKRLDAEILRLEYSFAQLTDELLASHLDFDYGDEDIMARHAFVSDDGRLIVGKAAYKAVVLPALRTIRSSTLSLLQKFQAAGGLIVFTDDAPPMVDALPSEAARHFAASCVTASGESLIDALNDRCRRVFIADVASESEFAPALYLLREDDEASYLFICNTGENFARPDFTREDVKSSVLHFQNRCCNRLEQSPEIHVCFFGTVGSVYEFNPDDGSICIAEFSRTKTGCIVRTSLPKLGSRLFVISKTKNAFPDASPGFLECDIPYTEIPLEGLFRARPSEANVLVLDRPTYKIGDGEWMPEKEILQIDHELRDALGIQRRGGHMNQPWTIPDKSNPRRIPVSLSYSFYVDDIPGGDLFLAIESPESCKIFLNGTNIPTSLDCGWWTDPSLRRIRLDPNLLLPGENIFKVEVDFTENFSGLEIMYLLGDFAVHVEKEPVLTEPIFPGWEDEVFSALTLSRMAECVSLGDLCRQGYPFFAGNFGYIVAAK